MYSVRHVIPDRCQISEVVDIEYKVFFRTVGNPSQHCRVFITQDTDDEHNDPIGPGCIGGGDSAIYVYGWGAVGDNNTEGWDSFALTYKQ